MNFSMKLKLQAKASEDDNQYFIKSIIIIREMMKTCTRQCGISHSVRRESALIKLTVNN